ncbi:hypothetical protein G7092_28465 [Mucilaginibacter sp. HC2]|jgi:hypothetical protein|uniref:hypothetical protein n=1 Tax=Mucilaginibacter inviolabilis TaxID=2714892 RepID=UPI001407880C|nr:hypothetical protein [Mucilaginibacter inviolabilis]NHA07766.1 hypothetical protein [Mucilaginibacter inviolabilis]
MKPIDLSIAQKMVERYAATRKKLIDKEHNINDTQSVWLSLDKLKSFINNLPEHATGVRIHFAAYDHNNEHYPNQTTAILIGTSENHIEHTDAIEDGVAGPLGSEDPMGPFNQGPLCPPKCP